MTAHQHTDRRLFRLAAPALLLLLGAALRIAPLTDFRFHADEALYASYGRLISTYDPLLASRLVDKPPLSFYLMAASFMRIGPHEIAARLPGLFASFISLALVWRLARALWADYRVALLALTFVALSPLAILFAPTAFTDPLLSAFLLAALTAAVRGKPGRTGLWFALALMTKQGALFFVPLVVGFVVCARNSGLVWSEKRLGLECGLFLPSAPIPLSHYGRGGKQSDNVFCHEVVYAGGEGKPQTTGKGTHVTLTQVFSTILKHIPLNILKSLSRFMLPIFVAIALLAIWNAARPDVPGFWAAGYNDRVPTGFAPANEIGPRLAEWLGWLRYVGGWWPANLALIAGFVVGTLLVIRRRDAAGVMLAGYVLAYLLAHWLLTFYVYDRYLLPIVPLLALVAARGWLWLTRQRVLRALAALLLVMAWPAFNAAQGAYPVGSDKGAYDGIEPVAAYLDALPDGTIIYDHWLGWPLDFYLFDSPHYTTFFETPASLADMLRQQDAAAGAVLVLPVWIAPHEHIAVVAAVESADYGMLPDFEVSGRQAAPTLAVYKLVPQ